MNAVALTDRGNLYGAMDFFRAAKRAGIKPIFGLELTVTASLRHQDDAYGMGQQRGFPVTILAKNEVGFRNLVQLSSAQCTGRSRDGGPVAVGKDVLKAHADGLICLSGGVEGELFQAIMMHRYRKARLIAGWFQKVFGERFYLEIQNTGFSAQDHSVEALNDVAHEVGVPTVASGNVQYVEPQDFEGLVLLDAMSLGSTIPGWRRPQQPDYESHLLSPAEMYERFPGYAAAVERSQAIADDIDLDLETRRSRPIAVQSTTTNSVSVIAPGSDAAQAVKVRVLFRNASPRAAIRNVCSKLGQGCEVADAIVELIPQEYGGTLKEAPEKIPALKAECQKSSFVRRIIELATLIEGKFYLAIPSQRNVLMSRESLADCVPLAMHEGTIFTQWDARDLPDAGSGHFRIGRGYTPSNRPDHGVDHADGSTKL